MSRIKFLLLIVFFINYVGGGVFAHSLEITTGSGEREGILDENGSWIKNGSLVEVYEAGADKLLSEAHIGYNFPFNKDQGKFDIQISVNAAEKIYVRAWDSNGNYGDSEVYQVRGIEGEYWNIMGEENVPAIKIR